MSRSSMPPTPPLENATDRSARMMQQMMLEGRRDFLKKHCDMLAASYPPSCSLPERISGQPIDAHLKAEIQALTDYLVALRTKNTNTGNTQLINFIDAVVIDKVGKDGDGISTRLAKHFAQLTSNVAPYVSLTEQGAKLYWQTSKNRDHFYAILAAHGIPATRYDGDNHNDSVSRETGCSVVVSHLHVEALLALAQYHSYSLKPCVTDWYESKQLNHAALYVKTAEAQRQSMQQVKLPVSVASIERVPFNTTEDLVKVTLAAEIPKATPSSLKPKHVVILLDDSGSMAPLPLWARDPDAPSANFPDKMEAANKALRAFVDNLYRTDPETLITIQSMNEKTLWYRVPVKCLATGSPDRRPGADGTPAGARVSSIQAKGETPLIEILVNSAVFLRQNPENLTIPQEEIDNTTVVLLSDGQPNGTAEYALTAMRTSAGGRFPFVIVPGLTNANFASYGIEGFECRSLPAILPMSIGEDANQVFMSELASSMHMPEVFVSTNEDMQKDIKHGMACLKDAMHRVPQCFVGLTYTKPDNTTDVKGVEEYHLNSGFARKVYFKIPTGSSHLAHC